MDIVRNARKLSFQKERESLAMQLLQEWNQAVFDGELPVVTLEWSQTLNKTAGRAHGKRYLLP